MNLQVQDGIPTIWAIVDPAAEMESRTFVGVPTGRQFHAEHATPPELYIGTFQLQSGLVFHLFEVRS